jgi:transposase
MLSQIVVGIDVAKAQWDITLRPTGTRVAVSNDDAGIASLVPRLQEIAPQRMVLEATGSYQRACPPRWSIPATRVTLPRPPDS